MPIGRLTEKIMDNSTNQEIVVSSEPLIPASNEDATICALPEVPEVMEVPQAPVPLAPKVAAQPKIGFNQLASMTIAELRKKAKELGVPSPTTLRKDDLIV